MSPHNGVHLFVIPFWINHLVNVGVAAIALWKGGRNERAIGVGWALLAYAQTIVWLSWPGFYRGYKP